MKDEDDIKKLCAINKALLAMYGINAQDYLDFIVKNYRDAKKYKEVQ